MTFNWGISDILIQAVRSEQAERITEAELHRLLRAVSQAQRHAKQTTPRPARRLAGVRRSLAAGLRRLADSIDLPAQPIQRSASRP